MLCVQPLKPVSVVRLQKGQPLTMIGPMRLVQCQKLVMFVARQKARPLVTLGSMLLAQRRKPAPPVDRTMESHWDMAILWQHVQLRRLVCHVE